MSALSDYTEQNLLNHVLRGVALAAPAADNYFALFTATPADAGGGTEVSTSGTGYVRKAFTRNGTNWNAASARSISNALAITFATPSGAWGTVSYWGIFDAVSAGNLLAWGQLTLPKVVGATDPAPSWAAGQFVFNMTDGASGGISTFLGNAILEWLFRATAFPTLGTNGFSLHTGAPGLTGASEVSGGAYARSSVARSTGTWGAPGAPGSTTNTNQQNFPAPTGANWGSITYGGLWDNTAAGNFLCWFTQTAKTVNDGDAAPFIAAAAASIALA